MKTAWLVVLGTCIGALGAWVLRDDASVPSAIPGAGRDSARSGGSNPFDRAFANGASGSDDVFGASGDAAAVDSLKRRAESAPRDAFSKALALRNGGLGSGALIQVARIWARNAPEDALEAALGLPEDLRALVASAVAEEWAFVDPAGFLAYAQAAGSIDPIVAGLQVLLATDPESVWEIADRHGGRVGSTVDELYLGAVRAMAGRDPTGTIARFQALATGQRRDSILSSIAEGYADQDPEAALAWALSLQPLSPDAASAVIRMIAVEDPLRAYEAVRQSAGPGLGVDSLRWILGAAVLESRQDPASIATALVERYEPEFSGPLVSSLLRSWVQQAPDEAMDWLSANRTKVTPEAVTTMVSDLAFDDVQLAASVLDRVPPEFEFQWLQETAKRYGQFDPDAAVAWVSQFEARPDYDQLLSQMVDYGNSRFVMGLVATSDHPIDSSAINRAANQLARQDPRSAAEWALGLKDPDRSSAALYGVTTGWLLSDPAAAQRWALDLPRGETRDEVLDAIFEQGTRSPLDLEALIKSYSSSAVADRSIAEYVKRIVRQPNFFGERGISKAEELIGLMADPDLRREAEAAMAGIR